MNHLLSTLEKIKLHFGWFLFFLLLLMLTFVVTLPILAQSGGEYELSRSSTDGSVSNSAGAEYALSGILGQGQPGLLSGGSYTLVGGFGGDSYTHSLPNPLYLPMVLK